MSRFDDLQIEILYRIWENAYKPGSSYSFHFSELDKFFAPEQIFGAAQAALNGVVTFFLDHGIESQPLVRLLSGLAAVPAQISTRLRKAGDFC